MRTPTEPRMNLILSPNSASTLQGQAVVVCARGGCNLDGGRSCRLPSRLQNFLLFVGDDLFRQIGTRHSAYVSQLRIIDPFLLDSTSECCVTILSRPRSQVKSPWMDDCQSVMGRVARPGGNKLDPEDWKRGRMDVRGSEGHAR